MQRVDSSKEGLDCVWPKNDEVYEISFKFVKQINLGAQAGDFGKITFFSGAWRGVLVVANRVERGADN